MLNVPGPDGGPAEWEVHDANLHLPRPVAREAIQGMIRSPEDRTQVVAKLMKGVGGKLLSYYVTFGEYDWLLIAEAPDEQAISAAVLTAAAGGSVTDLRTTVAMTPAQAKQAFTKAGELAGSFRSAGQAR
jgi:uncharacterized protein with GYD domain